MTSCSDHLRHLRILGVDVSPLVRVFRFLLDPTSLRRLKKEKKIKKVLAVLNARHGTWIKST